MKRKSGHPLKPDSVGSVFNYEDKKIEMKNGGGGRVVVTCT